MQIFANNAFSTLAAAIAAGDTTMTVQPGQGSKFPSPTNGDYFVVTLFQLIGGMEANHEIVKVTARSVDTFTIARGQEGTAARAWGVGDQVSHRGTAGTLGALAQLGAAGQAFAQPIAVPTAAPGTNTAQAASTQFVKTEIATAVSSLINNSPAALDTLNEIATALGNDPNFSATMMTALGNRVRTDVNTQGLSAAQKANAVANLGLAAVAVSGAKADIGLGNVDNTSDANKPISSATQSALNLLAPLASPGFTGVPTVPTAAPGTNNTQAANTAFAVALVNAAIANLVNSSPAALDTLKELADALGDDAHFAATVTNALAAKAPLVSPTFTGVTNAGRTYLGTAGVSAQSGLTMNPDTTGNATWNLIAGSGTDALQIGTGANPYVAFTEIMRLTAIGRVGIGTATPGVTLDVNGDAGFSTVTARAARVTHGQGAYLEWNKSGGDGATYLLNQKGGGGGGFTFGDVSAANVVTPYAVITGGGDFLVGTATDSGKVTSYGVGTNPAFAARGKSGADIAPDISIARTSSGTSIGTGPCIQFDDGTGNNSRMIQGGAGNMQFFGANGGGWSEHARFDIYGNFLVGVTSSGWNSIRKATTPGGQVFGLGPAGGESHRFYVADTAGASAAATVYSVDKINSTGRSISTAGFVSTSGADYAEYMTKADDCGVIAKGAIVGIDANGKLTDKWSNAVSFLIKSTDPSYVGGDTWGSEESLSMTRPVAPLFTPPNYSGGNAPVEPTAPTSLLAVEDDDSDVDTREAAEAQYEEDLAQYHAAMVQYQADQAQHETDMQAYADQVAAAQHQFDAVTMPAYQAQLAVFEAVLEAARQKVDRIAYCGQVPVNVLGAKPGDYVVPAPDSNGGIQGVLVAKADLNFGMYRDAVGIVQNILPDGRANVRVKSV